MANHKTLTLKSTLIDSHHCVMINECQVDIFYSFDRNTLNVYVEGIQQIITRFTPARMVLNYNNILDVAATYYQAYKKREEEFI